MTGWSLRTWAKHLKQQTLAVYYVAKDERTPWLPRIIAMLVAAYAFSPIDLIPDFIPVLGLLDDLIILPLGIALALRLVPQEIWQAAQERAAIDSQRPASLVAAVLIATIWLSVIAALGWWSYQAMRT